MAKIAEVVKLKSGYANFVELKSAFEAAQENADRMAMYRPTKAHRQAFERICRGLYQPNYGRIGDRSIMFNRLRLKEIHMMVLKAQGIEDLEKALGN